MSFSIKIDYETWKQIYQNSNSGKGNSFLFSFIFFYSLEFLVLSYTNIYVLKQWDFLCMLLSCHAQVSE